MNCEESQHFPQQSCGDCGKNIHQHFERRCEACDKSLCLACVKIGWKQVAECHYYCSGCMELVAIEGKQDDEQITSSRQKMWDKIVQQPLPEDLEMWPVFSGFLRAMCRLDRSPSADQQICIMMSKYCRPESVRTFLGMDEDELSAFIAEFLPTVEYPPSLHNVPRWFRRVDRQCRNLHKWGQRYFRVEVEDCV